MVNTHLLIHLHHVQSHHRTYQLFQASNGSSIGGDRKDRSTAGLASTTDINPGDILDVGLGSSAGAGPLLGGLQPLTTSSTTYTSNHQAMIGHTASSGMAAVISTLAAGASSSPSQASLRGSTAAATRGGRPLLKPTDDRMIPRGDGISNRGATAEVSPSPYSSPSSPLPAAPDCGVWNLPGRSVVASKWSEVVATRLGQFRWVGQYYSTSVWGERERDEGWGRTCG